MLQIFIIYFRSFEVVDVEVGGTERCYPAQENSKTRKYTNVILINSNLEKI